MPSRFLNIFCSHCKEFVLRYRKEGSGSLIRIHLKNIIEPEHLKKYKHTGLKLELPPLNCLQCQKRLGIPTFNTSGNRPAYRMIKGSFFKKEPK